MQSLTKFSIKDNKFIITNKCCDYSLHNNISYQEFSDLFEQNKIYLLDFNLKK